MRCVILFFQAYPEYLITYQIVKPEEAGPKEDGTRDNDWQVLMVNISNFTADTLDEVLEMGNLSSYSTDTE